MVKKILMIIGVIAVLAILTACTTGNVAKQESDVIKIGLSASLTGEAASWGEATLAGATVAVNEINAKGGVNGKKIQLIVEDDKATSESVNVIKKFINVDKVDIILGPLASASAGPALPMTVPSNTPVILYSASAPNLVKIGDNIFRIYPSDAMQGSVIADYIANDMQKKKVAVIYVKNDWGEGLYKVFKKDAQAAGMEIVYEAGILQTDTDLKTEITKIKNSDAEVVFVPIYPVNAIAFFKQYEELGLDLPLVGGDGFAGAEIVESGYGDGVVYFVPKMKESDELIAKVHALPEFKDTKTMMVTPLAYDAVYIAVDAIQKAGTENNALIAELSKTNYNGVSNSQISFDENGDLVSAEYEAWTIQNKKSFRVN